MAFLRKVPVVGKCLYAEAKGQVVEFPSIRDAAKWAGGGKRVPTIVQQIRACLTGKQKTAYMVRWEKKCPDVRIKRVVDHYYAFDASTDQKIEEIEGSIYPGRIDILATRRGHKVLK